MSAEALADKTAILILEALNCDMDRKAEISTLIDKAIIQTIKDANFRYTETVNICCSADQDLAHKISDEIAKKENLLITQLKSMY